MTYRNKLEAKIAHRLGAAYSYEPGYLPYKLPHRYLPDFVDEAHKRIVEVKGRFTAADRAKMKAIRDQYPDYEITIAFQNAHAPINKDSKTTYGDWCTQNNILFTSEQATPPKPRTSAPTTKGTVSARNKPTSTSVRKGRNRPKRKR